jgi:NADH:ubiquinone oxidoreductase subunit K
MNLTYYIFLISAALLFATGLYCLLMTRNLIRILISLEILTKSVTLLLVVAGFYSGRTELAQALIITMIIVEVVVITVGAGIVLGVFRRNNSLDTRKLMNLKG